VEIVAPVGLVTDKASLLEGRLMEVRFLVLLRLIGVATQADIDRVRLLEAGRITGMRVVAVGAIASRTWMLNLCFLDLFGLLGVAGDANLLRGSGDQHHFAVFWRCMAGIALPAREWHVGELRHQMLLRRLVRIVAGKAVRFIERLTLVRLDKGRIFRIMTIDAKGRSILGQVEIEFALTALAGFVGYMAGIAAHVQGGVTAAVLGDIDPDLMAAQAQV
jgi:hypothetical protein